MLIMCPECKKQFSETALSCPNCGYIVDEAIRQNLKAKAVRFNRGCLTTFAIVLLVFAGPCMIAPFTSHHGHITSTRSEAYNKFQDGKHLLNSDVDALANGVSEVTPEEETEASWGVFWLRLFILLMPGAGILLYLHSTKPETEHED